MQVMAGPREDRETAGRPAWRSGPLVAAMLVALALLVAGDLALKWWAFNSFPDQPVEVDAVLAGRAALPDAGMIVAPKVLAIQLVLNRGAVFGLGQGFVWLFVLFTVIAVGAVGWAFASSKTGQWLLHLTLVLVLAGALGNLYDRIVHEAVRDMLWLFPGVELPFGWAWARGQRGLYPWVFNLADVYLTCGIALLLVRAVFVRPAEAATESEAGRSPAAAERSTSA